MRTDSKEGNASAVSARTRKIRVLVVEDSITVRKVLCATLALDPEIDVIGEAGDGKRAIELCRDLRPDVMTLDMMLPVMSGLAATEYIMAHCPTPILIVSSSTNRGEIYKTYEALAAGALDVLEKPRGDEADGEWERQFLAAVKMASRILVITHVRARLSTSADLRARADAAAGSLAPARAAEASRRIELVAIGASTGGPGAMVEVLRGLAPEFSLPVLFVLHISHVFAESFADWLGRGRPAGAWPMRARASSCRRPQAGS